MTQDVLRRRGRPRPVPRESLERCALRAQLRGDPMLGTAFPAARVLLVEQPGPWGPGGLLESHFDNPSARALIRRAGAAGIRVQAIRRVGRSGRDGPRQWLLADSRDGCSVLRRGTYRAEAELLALPLDGSAGEVDPETLYLVCAHSKHDVCCALRGRPVAAALEHARPGRVFECSHLGGDRFAANVLVLPSGLLYGRLLPFAAAEFAAAAEGGQVVPELLRGRIGLPPVTQAALAFGYEYLAVRDRDALQVLETGPITEVPHAAATPPGERSARQAVVRLRGPESTLRVVVAVERVAADGLTCGNPRPNHYLRYRPVSVSVDG